MSKARKPPLKKVPSTIWSECQQVGSGTFSWMLWAPKRPLAAKAWWSGSGQVAIGTRLVSSRASRTQISFGQSLALFSVDSSVTSISPRSNSGTTVCMKPEYGGELVQDEIFFGFDLSEMS